MRLRLAIALALVTAASSTGAVESTAWPPSPETLARMRELQATMSDPATTKDERAAARKELERLMKAPGAPEGKPGDAKKPARAAIEPTPPIGSAFEYKPLKEPPPTARLEVIEDPPAPRRPVINPANGHVIVPTSPGSAIDPRTGRVLTETPSGYIDPRNGQFIPKGR